MAGRIPQSFINDLLTRVDIVDVIGDRMTLKKAGKNYSGLCPFHDEKTPSFSVSPDKQFYHCFGCQESGTALTFLMNFERMEFVEAVETLARSMGLEVPREQSGRGGPARDPHANEPLYDVLARAERYYRQALRASPDAIAYLKGRGLTGEIARDFGIGYAPEGWQNLSEHLSDVSTEVLLRAGLQTESDKGRAYDRFRARIMFPIRDTRGRIIGFGGRTLQSDDGPKYLNSPETPIFHKGAELYGLYEARRALRRIDRLLVVEGYMDVVALAQHGVANAVATLGTASGESHFHKLFRYADEVVCCFDGDQAGRQAAWKALENALPTLNEHRQLKLVFLPDGEDPDSLVRARGREGFEEFVNNAVPGLEFLFQRLASGLDMTAVDGRARFAGLVQPYIDRVPEGVLKTLLQQKAAQQSGLALPASAGRDEPPLSSYGAADSYEQHSGQPHTGQGAGQGLRKRSSKLSKRLLTLLLKYPEVWPEAPSEDRQILLEAASGMGLFGDVMTFVHNNPGADTEELLIHWSDHEGYPVILEAAQKHLEISADLAKSELLDGVARLGQQLRVQQRRVALAGMKENPGVDTLREYWSLHNDKAGDG